MLNAWLAACDRIVASGAERVENVELQGLSDEEQEQVRVIPECVFLW